MAVLEIRHCADIGLWSIDRPRSSCKWASEFCKMTCYNRSIESRFRKSIPAKDARNEASWKSIDGRQLADMLDRKRTPTERIRLMTRGEAFSTPDDIARVRGIAESNPQRLFWIPTRAWRDPEMEALIRETLFHVPNLRILASTDPSTSPLEDRFLRALGWSTMFYGDDTATGTPGGRPMLRCPKTWQHLTAHCAVCKAGCFRRSRVDVHLKQH
jgi:hypothetical protein